MQSNSFGKYLNFLCTIVQTARRHGSTANSAPAMPKIPSPRRPLAGVGRPLWEASNPAPAYDPAPRGGRYPPVVRIAPVRDRELRPLVADVLNTPAYGSGMNPLGMLNKLVCLPDSRELLRQRRLVLEPSSLTCENAAVGVEEYRRMRAMARWQEWKGRLVDALYRRESALSQLQVGTPAYERASDLLTRQVNAMEREEQRAAVSLTGAQLSGYDADIDYLRRMWRHHEGVPDDDKQERVLFAPEVARGADGRYYLFYAFGFMGTIGVAVCDTPAGRYEYLGRVHYPDGTPYGRRAGDGFAFDPAVPGVHDGPCHYSSSREPRPGNRGGKGGRGV